MTTGHKATAFYHRLGALAVERYEPEMPWSRGVQICKTWRMHFAWHLANALGWRDSLSKADRERLGR